MERPETGVMKFGDDWPGVFIRGDNAAAYAMALHTHLTRPGEDAFAEAEVRCLLDLLCSSRVRFHHDVEPQMAILVEGPCAHPTNE